MVVTKVDICPPTVLKQTRQALAKYLRQNQKMPYPIKDVNQASARPTPARVFMAVDGVSVRHGDWKGASGHVVDAI